MTKWCHLNGSESYLLLLLFISSQTYNGDHGIVTLLQCTAAFISQLYHHLQGINYRNVCPSDLQVKLYLVLELSAGHIRISSRVMFPALYLSFDSYVASVLSSFSSGTH